MKHILIFILISFLNSTLNFGQDTIYYSIESNKVSTIDSAFYYNI